MTERPIIDWDEDDEDDDDDDDDDDDGCLGSTGVGGMAIAVASLTCVGIMCTKRKKEN